MTTKPTKPTNADDGGAATKPKLTAKHRFERGWVDSGYDTLSGRFYGKYEFYQKDIDIIKTALEASRPAQDIVAEMRDRLESEIRDCEALEAEHRSRSKAELDDEWMTADEIQHRIGGLKFALAILSPTKNTAPTEAEES